MSPAIHWGQSSGWTPPGLVQGPLVSNWRCHFSVQSRFIATHSPILLACPGATIYSFDHAPIAPIGYEQTEHYQTYKSFMNDRHLYSGGD